MNSNTKELNSLFLKLHTVNSKIESLDLEYDSTGKGKEQYLLTRTELEDESLNILRQIEAITKQTHKATYKGLNT